MISISSEPIDLEGVISELSDDSIGATAIFIGTVRNNDNGERVLGITYEVYYEMAIEHLGRVKNEINAKWAVSKFTAIQRTGFVKAGETSVVVAAASVHREDAFNACRYGIEKIKTSIPVWKCERTENGEKWVKGALLEIE